MRLAQAELDRYRAFAPDIESHVEIRMGSTGVMVSNGDLLVAPTARVSAARADALLHHEVGTHIVTFVNGSHQQLRILASGLAGHEETQEGLAVLAEYLVGGLTAGRLRQLAARVVAVHQMVGGAEFPEVHRGLVDAGVSADQAFTITMRVFRSGGLTKDAVYLRGLHDLVHHLGAGRIARPALARQDAARRGAARRGPAPRGRARRPALAATILGPPRGIRPPVAHPRSRLVVVAHRRQHMRIGFVINSIATEKPEYTTVRLALAAVRKGHDTWMMGVDDFSHRADGTVAAHARSANKQEAQRRAGILDKHPGRRARLRRHLDQRPRRAA